MFGMKYDIESFRGSAGKGVANRFQIGAAARNKLVIGQMLARVIAEISRHVERNALAARRQIKTGFPDGRGGGFFKQLEGIILHLGMASGIRRILRVLKCNSPRLLEGFQRAFVGECPASGSDPDLLLLGGSKRLETILETGVIGGLGAESGIHPTQPDLWIYGVHGLSNQCVNFHDLVAQEAHPGIAILIHGRVIVADDGRDQLLPLPGFSRAPRKLLQAKIAIAAVHHVPVVREQAHIVIHPDPVWSASREGHVFLPDIVAEPGFPRTTAAGGNAPVLTDHPAPRQGVEEGVGIVRVPDGVEHIDRGDKSFLVQSPDPPRDERRPPPRLGDGNVAEILAVVLGENPDIIHGGTVGL
ncbi:hypothetical protein BH09VER1_BH09VER1_53570 [soil metagenome]